MAEKTEDINKEKIQKLTRVLKELEEKYKKIYKDRSGLLGFAKAILPSNPETITQLEASPGQIDGEKLLSVYKSVETGKISEEVEPFKETIQTLTQEKEALKIAETSLKLKIEQEMARAAKLETELKKQANEGANALLAKIKNAGQANPPSTLAKANSFKEKEALETKVREQANLILSLKSQLTDSQNTLSKTLPLPKAATKDSQAQTDNPVAEDKSEVLKKELADLQNSFEALQNEHNGSRKKAQMLLSEKEAEIGKLKATIKSLRKAPKTPEKGSKTERGLTAFSGRLNVTAGTATSSSVASLGGDDKAVIAQLEQRVKELTEVITLQSNAEQALSKKLQYLEGTRSKGEINYEYIKNVLLKYLIFKEHGEPDAKRMEDILLDLLKVNRQEKESLEKAREKQGFWGLFYKDTAKEEALANLNTSYVVQPHKLQRAQTEAGFDFKRKANSELSINEEDFENDSAMLHMPVSKALSKK